MSSRGCGSLWFDVGSSDHLAPLLGFFGNELAEVGRRAWKCGGTPLGKPRLHLGVGEGRVDLRARWAWQKEPHAVAAKLDPAEFPDARNQLELLDRLFPRKTTGDAPNQRRSLRRMVPASVLVQTPQCRASRMHTSK